MNKRLSYIPIILLMLYASLSYTQQRWPGNIQSLNTQLPLKNAEIILDSMLISSTGKNGSFTIEGAPDRFMNIIIFHENYNVLDTTIWLDANIEEYTFNLVPLSYEMTAIEIQSRRKEIFAVRQLKDVEGTTINAGKKTEVVVLENINANLAVNRSRQIFAQVAGLNIYEGSDGGLQLAIGGRGLDPNRTANFNTRQNGYDISADVLGYPESYYTPPAHAIREIQIIRGASSLQYGTQFGGLINFRLNMLPVRKSLSIKSAQSVGSYGLYDSFNQLSWRKDKWKSNVYYNYKRGNGYRENSSYDSHNTYAMLSYKLNDKATLSGEFTYYTYLAQQAGGLTDQQFSDNPRLSTRERNWFNIDWKLFNLKYTQDLSPSSKISLSLFMLRASRKALGFRGNAYNLNENPILALDEQDTNGNYILPRDLIRGSFKNYGAELRWINELSLLGRSSVLLTGIKWYDADNASIQGPGSSGSDSDFSLQTSAYPDYAAQSDYRFPNHNLALFSEYIFYLNNKWSITPGLRYEHINTAARGQYTQVVFDNAGNPIANTVFQEDRKLGRSFLLAGIGVDFKPDASINAYANVSQNYRSVTFSDIRVVSPSFKVDPDITDEKGYTFDLGVKGRNGRRLSYNMGVFGVLYQRRIGIIFDDRANRVRKNIGDALILGTELLLDYNMLEKSEDSWQLNPFINAAYTYTEYLTSESANVKGKRVEFVPTWNLKTGITGSKKSFNASLQYTYLSSQFTDAQNSPQAAQGDLRSGIIGEIPDYGVADLSLSYKYGLFTFTTGINNILDENYFTRRATGYPGPGIIPSEGRNFYLGVEVNIQ